LIAKYSVWWGDLGRQWKRQAAERKRNQEPLGPVSLG
jgi:hypothetical protein